MQHHLTYSPKYNTNLSDFGIDKPFALDRGQCVLNQLEKDFGHSFKYIEPTPISVDDILLVHSREYIESLNNPKTWLDIFEFKENEYKPEIAKYPLNEILDDIRMKCGGTLLAAEIALKHGLAANLGGGYHHAFPNQGRGFCSLHDIAIAARSLQKRGLCKKILVLDLDFHQGDGTAVIFQNDPDVYTLSVHSEEGWPEEKQQSTLDVGIRTNESEQYLSKTKQAIATAFNSFSPDLCIYVAGSDPYELDVLPGTKFLKLTLEQMRERDEFVIDTFADKNIPLVSVFAGGYGPDVWEVHYWATRRLLMRTGII